METGAPRKHPDLDPVLPQFPGHVADPGCPDRGIHNEYEPAFVVGVCGYQVGGFLGGQAFADRGGKVLESARLGSQLGRGYRNSTAPKGIWMAWDNAVDGLSRHSTGRSVIHSGVVGRLEQHGAMNSLPQRMAGRATLTDTKWGDMIALANCASCPQDFDVTLQ